MQTFFEEGSSNLIIEMQRSTYFDVNKLKCVICLYSLPQLGYPYMRTEAAEEILFSAL
jgi:hypothetical protein